MRRPIQLGIPLFAASLVLFAGALPAHAGFVASVTGEAQVISPPASSVPGALVSNDLQVWDESSGKLSANLTLDLGGQPGSYDGLTNYTTLNTTLSKGTAYNSVMIQLDPTSPYRTAPVTASITFTSKIIGIALFGTSLNASDIYGNPTTVYPTGLPNLFLQTRGIDYTHADRLSISSNGETLSLQLPANFGIYDQIRVFTAGSVPEPASLFVWSAIGLVLVVGAYPSRLLRPYTFGRRKPVT
ncbi:MAG TPA: hypothetical protein VMR25_02130 [Planctomycetaceae bacterium]|nr:hypothetical protein [Planctomycetaceae bacterium]